MPVDQALPHGTGTIIDLVAIAAIIQALGFDHSAQAMAKLSTSFAKLTERKGEINAEISALPDQRTALKAAPIAVAVPVVVAQRPRSLPRLRPKMQFLSKQSGAPPRSKNMW